MMIPFRMTNRQYHDLFLKLEKYLGACITAYLKYWYFSANFSRWMESNAIFTQDDPFFINHCYRKLLGEKLMDIRRIPELFPLKTKLIKQKYIKELFGNNIDPQGTYRMGDYEIALNGIEEMICDNYYSCKLIDLNEKDIK